MLDWLGIPSFLVHPFLMNLLLGVACPLAGTYLILRRSTFLAVTLPQIAAMGLALGFFFEFQIFSESALDRRWVVTMFAILFSFAAAQAIIHLPVLSPGGREVLLAVVYAVSGAAAVVLLAANPIGEFSLLSTLQGEILAASEGDLARGCVILGGAAAVLWPARRWFLAAAYDPDLVRTQLLPFRCIESLWMFATVLILVAAVSACGVLATFGLTILPAIAAVCVARGAGSLFLLAPLFGGFCSTGGFFAAMRLDWPIAPANVLVAGGLAATAALMRARRKHF